MKKIVSIIFSIVVLFVFISCSNMSTKKPIELMGAGDRIHDTYTFANTGVKIEEKENNIYRIYGSVEKLDDDDVKKEFKIDDDVNNVVAIKLSAMDNKIDKKKLYVKVDGVRSYDAEHLNGSNYTFIILEAQKGKTVSISVSWNGEKEINYVISFDDNLTLK